MRGLLIVTFAAGCSTAPPIEPSGSDGWGIPNDRARAKVINQPRPAAPRPKAIAEGSRVRWPDAALLDALAPIGSRGPSEHLDGLLERTTHINEAAGAYARLVPGIVIPEGALIVQRHFAGTETHSLYIMRKTRKGWSFAVLDPQYRIAAAQPLEICARCHLDAPYAGLFGPEP